MAIRERKRLRKRLLLAAGLLAILSFAMLSDSVSAQSWDELDFGARGYVMNDSDHFPLTERWQGPSATLLMTDRQTLASSETGETADAFYLADLAAGTLNALAATASGRCPGPPACVAPHWGYIAQAKTWVRFKDTLSFQIPAGSYPDGASAQLHGYAFGWLDAFSDTGGATGASGGYYANFQTSGLDTAGGYAEVFSYDSRLAYESFTLTVRLVDAGTVLNQSITVDGNFEAGLGNAYLTSQAHGDSIQGLATSNWTMQFDSLDVPAGVTWSSASGVFLSVEPEDSDNDSVPDVVDNCIYVTNTDQRDTNGDGFGNICDPDLNNDLDINFPDLLLMRQVFFTSDPDADLDGNATVNFVDLAVMRSSFFGPPGPSGIVP